MCVACVLYVFTLHQHIVDGNHLCVLRVQQWFHVGMSLAPLLQLDSGWQFIRACAQLMEEFEYHFSSVAMQGMVRRKNEDIF